MSNFLDALQSKIALLEDEKEELEDALSRISSKLDVLRELLQEENGTVGATSRTVSPAVKRKPGRPKGKKAVPSAPRVDQDVLNEASQLEGTDPHIAAAIRQRGFSASPLPVPNYGPGVRVDQNVKRSAPTRSNASISVEDNE